MKLGTIEHPKTARLAQALDVPLLMAAGLLQALWHFAARYAPDGDIGRFDHDEIATGCHWPADRPAAAMITALVRCRWLDQADGRLVVHDWQDHAEAWIRGVASRRRNSVPDSVRNSVPENPELSSATSSLALPCLALPIPTHSAPDGASPRTRRKAAGPGTTTPSIAWTPEAGWTGIADADRTRWRAAYPACDLDRQLAAADAWCRANPTKAHKRRWDRFLANWLARSQDRGGDAPRRAALTPSAPSGYTGALARQRAEDAVIRRERLVELASDAGARDDATVSRTPDH